MFFARNRILASLVSFASIVSLTSVKANSLGSSAAGTVLPEIQVGDYRSMAGGGPTLHVGWVTGFGPYVTFDAAPAVNFSLDVYNDRRMMLFFEFDCALRLSQETPELLEVIQSGSCSQRGFEVGTQVSGPYVRIR